MARQDENNKNNNKPHDGSLANGVGPFSFLMKFLKEKKFLPTISETERQALEAGDPWIESGFFAGNPKFKAMLAEPYSKLTAEEQAFIDGPCEELCRMFDRYQVEQTNRIPEPVIRFVKDNGFMGLLIPKEHGGMGFSKLAISTVLHKLLPNSFAVGVFIMIPNSLGPAELIVHYGTDEQKRKYLPKLASGEYVPCFGLTEENAGSDAASLKSDGLVFQDTDGQLKLRLNFNKRFITLAPIANLCTIACKLRDPQNLLGKGEELDITCVLIEDGTPGFRHGEHHIPIGESFENGTLVGEDVVVPVDNIIGGPQSAGGGWKMLMEQLAGGRAISLPAGSVGNMKVTAAATSAYAMVRQQFGMSVGRMEGVEEKIAFIAAMTYLCEAARVFACSAVDDGTQPPVASAVLKAYLTDTARTTGIAGMDVFAGAGVMQGPSNILSKMYRGAPVGITVEGANILTRTLIIFGQGATRSHPYAQTLVNAVEKNDSRAFRNGLFGWTGHIIAVVLRTLFRSLTRGWTVRVPQVDPETRKYYRKLGWAAARFGLLTDMSMMLMGSKLKVRGNLTGRYADALAWMLLGFSTLRRYEAEGRRKEDLPLVHYALEHALSEVQKAFEGIYQNFDAPVIGFLMRTVGRQALRFNALAHAPSTARSHEVAKTQQSYSEQFKRLYDGMFVPDEHELGLGRLLKAFRLVTEAQDASARISKAQKARQLPRGLQPVELADEAVAAGLITVDEAQLLREAHAARQDAVHVDTFTHEQYYK
jgi:acyl-CoA dehydrogenase